MKVLIGIQARSGSTRLPNKAHELIAGTSILSRVIAACQAAASVIKAKTEAETEVAVVTPYHDTIAFEYRDRVAIVEGPEHDVLSRYMIAVEKLRADYLVRITGDCPLIPSNVIVGLTNLALSHKYDYISNVDERFRTSIDGTDCEVISTRLLTHISELAKEAYDREHVTPFIRHSPPEWAKIGVAIGHFDLSKHTKLSVDTEEDLDNVRLSFSSTLSKFTAATRVYGKGRVHRFG